MHTQRDIVVAFAVNGLNFVISRHDVRAEFSLQASLSCLDLPGPPMQLIEPGVSRQRFQNKMDKLTDIHIMV